MKLRIRGNSLRLRLLQGEVRQFGITGTLSEKIHFGTVPNNSLTYSLAIDPAARLISAAFEADTIVVKIPAQMAHEWTESEEISLAGEQRILSDMTAESSEHVLKILIEKDSVCLDRSDDPDNHDAFPHPTGKCS